MIKRYSTVEGSLGPPVGSSKETLGKVEEKFQVLFAKPIVLKSSRSHISPSPSLSPQNGLVFIFFFIKTTNISRKHQKIGSVKLKSSLLPQQKHFRTK